MFSKKIGLLVLLTIVASLLLSACGATPEPQVVTVKETVIIEGTPQVREVVVTEVVEKVITATPEAAAPGEPKILRQRLEHDIRTLDPAFHYSDIEEFAASPVFNGLVTYAPNSYKIINDLAESIEQSEDGLTVTFKLKEGVQWHRGYGEVTAEDVKFSYERYAQVDSPYKDDWALLDHVEVIDKYAGKIVLKDKFAPLWTSTMPTPRGWVLPKKYIEEVGAERFATDPVGSGAYVFAEWVPQEKVVLRRNPDYFGGPGAWDEIQLIVIEDNKAAEVAMEAGELDITYVSHAAADRFSADPRFIVVKKPQLHYRWVGMNVEHPKLQDINVRQAIRYAIDVPSILQAAYLNQVEPVYTLIPPGMIGHWKDAPKYQRDVAKAKEYLAAAGVQNLELHLATQDTSEYRAWAEVIQQNLKEVGINLIIDTVDETTFWSLGEGEKGKELELVTLSYSSMPDPAWYSMWFTCEQIGVWNWMRWCNPEFDELHKKGMVTLDNAEREQIYIEMQKLWDEGVHTVWITNSSRVVVHTPGVIPALTPHGQMQTRWMLPTQ